MADGAVNNASTRIIPTERINMTIVIATITSSRLLINPVFILSTEANSSSNRYARDIHKPK